MNSIPANPSSARAGRYVRQLTGYRAFLPAPLPPNPPIRLDQLYGLLSKADRALGRLDGSIQTLPNPAANNLVSRLAERGIIEEITGHKRNRLFRYQPYIALFAENPSLEPPSEVTTEGRAPCSPTFNLTRNTRPAALESMSATSHSGPEILFKRKLPRNHSKQPNPLRIKGFLI